MVTVGKEFVRDELVYTPAKLVRRKHYVEVVKCSVCGSDETKDAALPDIGKAVFKSSRILSSFYKLSPYRRRLK